MNEPPYTSLYMYLYTCMLISDDTAVNTHTRRGTSKFNVSKGRVVSYQTEKESSGEMSIDVEISNDEIYFHTLSRV